MKEQKNDIELLKKDGQEKQPYKKPKISTVKLIADQALGGCNLASGDIGCGIYIMNS